MSNHDREHRPNMEDALKAIFQSPAPSEAFVDQLEQQLRSRSVALSDRSRDDRPALLSRWNPLRRLNMLWQRSRALALNFVAWVALIILIVSLMALFSSANELAISRGTPTPSGPLFVRQGSVVESIGPVGQRQIPISVRAVLPPLPERVPLYDIKVAFENPSAELAHSWAEKLGLKLVRLYQDSTTPDATYIAQAEDGRMVRVGPGGQVMYQANLRTIFYPLPSRPAPAAPDLEAARSAAETFLKQIPDLFVLEGNSLAKVTVRVEPSPHQAPDTRAFGMTFEYTPLIDGLPIVSRSTPGTITVGANGQIQSATLTPLRITPAGKEAAVRSIDAVVQAFLNGDQTVLRGSGWGSAPTTSAAQPQSFHMREPSFAVGDNVTLKGGIQHWVAADGGSDLYLLATMGAQFFMLEGEGLNVSQPGVQITGRIAGQVQSGLWRIEVTAIKPIESGPQAYTDWTGVIRRQADGTWLETDGGQKYLLPDPPADLSDGERVIAPGVVIDNGSGVMRLEWWTIDVASQLSATGQMSGGVSSVEQRVVAPEAPGVPPIEPTQVITAPEPGPTRVPAVAVPPVYPNGVPYSTGVFQSITSGASGPIITSTLPVWWTYKPGDEVTLEGELSAQAYRIPSEPPSDQSSTPTPGRTIFEAHLLATKDENKPDEMVPITLVGDRIGVELVRLDGLHVRMQGRLLTIEDAVKRYADLSDKSLNGLALEVTRFEKALPNETKDVYSGQIRVETLDGQEVAIFSDTLSGKEFVLADSLTITNSLQMYRQTVENKTTLVAIGVVVSDKTFAGRPVLQLRETMSGGHPEEFVKTFRDKLENPIQDIGPVLERPKDVVIDRIELAYVFQTPPPHAPQGFTLPPTQLFYQLSGHSSDGRYTVTYDLEAAAATPPTPAPTPTPGEPARANPTTAPLAQPLTTEELAIEQVLKIDANIAIWDHPWSKDTLKLEPDRITLAAFPSRSAEAAGSGEGFSPEVDADAGAVWRVTIKGAVQLNLLGMGVTQTTKYDGVTYVISQRHGGLLSVSAGKPMSALPQQ